jgi:hypothetical protein
MINVCMCDQAQDDAARVSWYNRGKGLTGE